MGALKKQQQGFTLVELAIVMVIIGLLLGGVLKGQELITNAKASATIAKIKSYEAAVNTFRDAFDAIPGDLLNAGTRLPNCSLPNSVCNITMAPSSLRGNRRLETGPGISPNNGGGGREAIAFFPHLAAADLIGGIDPQALATSANITSWAGRIFPEAPIGGGFHVGWTDGIDVNPFGNGLIGANVPRRGLHLALHDNPGDALGVDPGNGEVLQPSHALRIDNKVDDGMPGTGFIRGGGTIGNGDDNCSDTNGDYRGRGTQPVCYIFIRLGG